MLHTLSLSFRYDRKNTTYDPAIKFLKAYEVKDPIKQSNGRKHDLKYGFNNAESTEYVAKRRMQFDYLKEYKDVFILLDNVLDFESFDTRKTVIVKFDDLDNVLIDQPELYQLFVDLHILNGQNQLNNYLLEVRKILIPGGVFVGALHPNHYRYHRFFKK